MIEIHNLHKSFNSKNVLNGVNLTINKGETLVIIGQSGCGKSVLIKLIVGLLKPDDGYVLVEGHKVNELNEKALYELRRNFGFLFQGAALFDSMTVGENVAMPLTESNVSYTNEEIDRIVNEKLDLVGLEGINNLKPSELSGGMRKRVGLARALATDPEYIFYDEPTTGLDPIMSDSIDLLIGSLKTKINATSIVVTHDMFSVKNIATKVAMLHDGKMYFTGTPDELLNSNDPIIIEFVKRTQV
ncbi:MAG: ABC transporter ATP-binding protein [Bacteroidota bacterium]|nr:ABC transporter ATP-binding protein [Bacteroidota bacterium]